MMPFEVLELLAPELLAPRNDPKALPFHSCPQTADQQLVVEDPPRIFAERAAE